ncbi:MAG TPA: beta-phosphoglucomutase family hydrolase [Dermatophilaceae bacterium]|nr:beta-phosphoglucomutase family hydrolase [Dermatophilaceae bacterium]
MTSASSSGQDHPDRSQRPTLALVPPTSLGLPGRVRACLFDLDGVLTDTARLHAAAWKEMFDGYLKARAEATGTTFVAFDEVGDYDTYVDGKSRADGTSSFLQSRGIDVPTGAPGDRAGALTIIGLGDAKNAILMRRIRHDGVTPYLGSVRYVQAVRSAGLQTAVVSSSANCAEVLKAAGIADLFETRIDGVSVEEQHLAGKPAPDTYLAAAKVLGVEPGEAAVFEDALSGVAAGRAGGFGFVVGVDRVGQAEQLRAHGADRVVTDLAQLLDPVDPA